MIKTELRLKIYPVVPLKNATFNNYTYNWSGNTVGTTTQTYPMPTFDDPNAVSTIPEIDGWTFSNTKYAVVSDGSAAPLFQNFDPSYVQSGFTYNVTFTVSNVLQIPGVDTPIGGVTPYFMGVRGTQVQWNGTYTQSFLVTGDTTALPPNVTFQPTSGFAGAINNAVINGTTAYYANVDLYDDDNLNLNFAYFEDVANRASTYSKTMRVPSTQNNAQVFKNILSVDVSLDLTDPNCVYMYKPIPCGLYYDSAQIMLGTFILTKVIKSNDVTVEYEGQFVSSTRSFADAVGEALLTDNEPSINPVTGQEEIPDLDFSMYDHTFNHNNTRITHKTTGSYTLEGATQKQSYSGATGVYYPFMDMQGEETGNYLYFNNLKPCLYVKEVFDKIFRRCGYQYQSTFLESSIFKSLVIPQLSKYQLDTESVYNLTFNVQRSVRDTYGYTYNNNGWYSLGNENGEANWAQANAKLNDDTPPVYYINNNSWSKTLYKMTIPTGKGGLYTFTANAICSVETLRGFDDTGQNPVGSLYTNIPGGTATADGISFRMGLWVKRGGQWSEFDYNEGVLMFCTASNDRILGSGGGPLLDDFGNRLTCSLTKEFAPVFLGDLNECELRLYIRNDNKYWWTMSSAWFPAKTSKAWGAFEAGSTLLCEYSADGNFHVGNRVPSKYILPKDTKQIDFVKSISNMFSLVWSDHPTIKDCFVIEPWNQFFSGITTAKDWTSKMDLSREIDYERIDFLIDKSVQLNYANDSRDYNINDYNETFKYPFGSKNVPNPVFEKEKNITELIFAPALIHPFGSTNWKMSQIYNKDDRDNNIKEGIHYWPSDFQPKILQRKVITNLGIGGGSLGLLNLRFPIEGLSASTVNPNTFPDGIAVYGNGQQFNNYFPYAGIYDDPYVPTLSIEFGEAKRYMDTAARPSINLYLKYWQQKINLFLDPNSKKVTAYFRLNYVDIANLDFRKLILVDNAYYYLYRIIEWNPESYSKVELIKTSTYTGVLYPVPPLMKKKSVQIVPVVVPSQVLNLETTVNNFYPSKTNASGMTSIIYSGNKYPKSARGLIIGKSNYIVGSDFLISASNNNSIVGDNTVILNSQNNTVSANNDTIIGGNSNTVSANNVTIIGSNSNNVATPDTLIIGSTNNNILPPTGNTIITDGMNVIINSQDNIISPNALRTVLINTSGQTIASPTVTPIVRTTGETINDGIVFYTWSGGTEGLICTLADQGSVVWGCEAISITGLTNGYTFGYDNTQIINSVCSGLTASSIINSGATTGDWYLPSRTELNEMYNQRLTISGFSGSYWASEELDSMYAYSQDFSSGTVSGITKSSVVNVRAIKVFYLQNVISGATKTYINNRDVDTLTDTTYVAANYFDKGDDIKLQPGKYVISDEPVRVLSGATYANGITRDIKISGTTFSFVNGVLVKFY